MSGLAELPNVEAAEFRVPTIEALMASPIGRAELIVGKLVPFVAIGYLQMTLILLLGWEHVDDAVDRLRSVVGVERREHEVTGFRSRHC